MSYKADQRLKQPPTQDAIPMEFIKAYVDSLIEFANKLRGSTNVEATMLRADHIMELVKAWQERNK